MVLRNSISKLAVLFFLILTFSVQSAESALEQVEKGVQQLFETAKPSVVQIKAICRSTPQLAVGSGFFIDRNGLILTSAAIVSDSNPINDIQVLWGTNKFDAKRIGFDPRTDLALIKIEAANTPPLQLGDSDNLQKGAMVIGVGYPRNSPLCPEVGYVSSVDLGQILKIFATSHIRSSVRVVEGQAGSPLLNTKSEVVGMLVATDGTHSYALPVAAIKKIQPDLVKYNQPQYGFVGIGIREITVDAQGNPLPEPKVVIEHLYPGTSAEQSGMKKGDVIVEINSAKVIQPADVMNATFYLRANDKIKIKTRNDKGQEKEYTIAIGPRLVASPRPASANSIPVSEKR